MSIAIWIYHRFNHRDREEKVTDSKRSDRRGRQPIVFRGTLTFCIITHPLHTPYPKEPLLKDDNWYSYRQFYSEHGGSEKV